MHIPDVFINVPTAVATTAISAGGLGVCLRRLRTAYGERMTPMMGVMSAWIFAAQMVKFPVAQGTAGHLCGGVLAAVLLGPWAGATVMTVVLIVQCLVFGDGGISALGANTLNMAILGSSVGYCIYAALRGLFRGTWGIAAAAVVAAWFATLLSAAACAFELAWSGTYPLAPTLHAMLWAHMLIGIGESLITGLALILVLRTRPDLVYEAQQSPGALAKTTQVLFGGLAIALVIAVFVSPFASELPDGLEWVAESLGFADEGAKPIWDGWIPDYKIPGWQDARFATSAAGLIGTAVVFVVALFVGRAVWRTPTVDPMVTEG